MNPIVSAILGIVGGLILGAVIGVFVGIQYRKRIGEAKIGSAEERAKEIVEEGEKKAETAKKEALLSAKEDIMRRKNEMEQEIKDRRAEVSRTETRLAKKEENLDKKSEQLDKKNEQLDKKLKECDTVREQIDAVLEGHMTKLEEISGYTAEQAKAELVSKLEEEVKYEQAQRLVALEEQYRDEADEKARGIMALAIQRCAGDFVAESTITSVALPSEEMKGRIIGREGRNIQKLETLTGVELIIDDTPETITISGFDPIRREVARLALEKLISDGRIHPTRIEEMVEKAKKDVDAAIKQAGERATFEVNIHGINPDLIRLLGRLRYRTSYGQNVLQHSIEVAILAGIMAEELGVDPVMARRAGLLHDIGKAFPYDVEGSHVQIGVNAAKKYKESKEVVHAIEAHHGDVEPQTVIAVLVQAADAISAARPGARREDMENYIKRLEKLEEIAESFGGIEKAFAIQAGRELRVMVKPEAVTDERMVLIAREMAERIQNEVKYPGQIKINLIRESRAVDYAK
ncbi:MAG: ribonuclease Y [Clostridia bacterium]|nr:ribonuclease Y [Clostridia bacterium]MBQ7315647.1 ribonuclease Y [Clostridia bacterium]